MVAPKIQADYDQLEQISKHFTQEAESLKAVFDQLRNIVEGQIRGRDWVGMGANNFMDEMEDLLFPAMNRLVAALTEASNATKRIAEAFQQAEDEAGSGFKRDSFSNMADKIIGNLIGKDPGFGSIIGGMLGGGGGGFGGGGGSFGSIADRIIGSTGGTNTDFGGIVNDMISRIRNTANGGGSLSDIVKSMLDSAGGTPGGRDVLNTLIGNFRGATGGGRGVFNDIADQMIAAMGGGSGGGDLGGGSGGGTGGGSGGGTGGGSGGGTGGGSGGGTGGGSGGGTGGGSGGGSGGLGGMVLGGTTPGLINEALARVQMMDNLRKALTEGIAKVTGMDPGVLGASLGGFISGPVGNAIGGAIGNLIGGIGQISQQTAMEALNQIKDVADKADLLG